MKTFFLESTCACVLGPWPWPRAFLSLASRVSVLGMAVLGLGLGFFCVLGLGLEPCVLDSTSAKRPQLNRVKQVLAGHCNLQRHKKITGSAESSLCPKYRQNMSNIEDETPNHHVGNCKLYQDIT